MSDLLDQCLRRTSELISASKPDLILSDARVKEFVNSAYESIILKLANRGLTSLRQEVLLTGATVVGASVTLLSTTSSPPIPEMYNAIRLWERRVNGTVWMDMQKVIDHLPVNAVPGVSLVWWQPQGDKIRLVGATNPVDVKLHYIPRATQFQMPRDAFGYPDLVNPVAYTAASRALGGSQTYDSIADQDLYNIASINSRLEQSTPVRLRRRRSGLKRS